MHRSALQLGPFTVTPYLVDDSAFDAYALLVEAVGRRVLYSGDLRAWLEARGIALTLLHSSGHASTADLQRFASAINAKEVVPIHTRQSPRYAELFSNARERADGEWWTV